MKGWISLQEKLDQTYGRKRKRASIGFYQADMVTSPLRYTVGKPDNVSFTPLGSETESTLREIVANHPKGLEYGRIVTTFNEWPLLIDGDEKVLSLPPIINSNDLGRITLDTRNILVEVTGTNAETVHNTLKIVVSALAERGGSIHSCQENYPYGNPRRIVSPDLNPTDTRLSLSSINKLLGTTLSLKEASRLAEKAGYHVPRKAGDTLHLQIPCYRTDIMHTVDIIEDLAIASDLNKLEPEWPKIWTIGELSKQTVDSEVLGEIMIGLGFQEVLTYILTDPEIVSGKMQMGNDDLVAISNPKMTTHTAMRNWILPSLLEFLSHNTHVDYPQKIFEIGSTINLAEEDDPSQPVKEHQKVAAAIVHATAGFTEIRSSLDALIKCVGHDFEVKSTDHPSFLSGRCGMVVSDGRKIGFIGELSPKVIQAFGLKLPTAAFELDMPKQIGVNHESRTPEAHISALKNDR